MFGYDDEELARIRRGRPRLRWWVVVLQCVFFGLLSLAAVPLQWMNHPEQLQGVLDRQLKNAKFRLLVEDFVMLPVGTWADPSSWRFVISGLGFVPRDPKKPDWRASRVTLTVPEVFRVGSAWGLHFPWLRVSSLEIHAHQQRPPPPWEPVEAVVAMLSADVVEVAGASFDAPPDPPIGAAEVRGIRGTLRDVVFRPGYREVSGEGEIFVDDFVTGNIQIRDAHLHTLTLDRSTLRFAGGFSFGSTPGSFTGEIRTFHIKAALELDVSLQGAAVSDVVSTATGSESSFFGKLDLDLRIEAGGERPRGRALLAGDARVTEGRVQLPKDTRYIVYDIIRIAPWVKLDAWNQVILGDLEGHLEFTRGTVTLEGLTYPAGKRKLRVDGTLESDSRYLLVRLLPREGMEHRLGFGVVLQDRDGKQTFRLARREDILKDEPWLPVEGGQTYVAPQLPPGKPPRLKRPR